MDKAERAEQLKSVATEAVSVILKRGKEYDFSVSEIMSVLSAMTSSTIMAFMPKDMFEASALAFHSMIKSDIARVTGAVGDIMDGLKDLISRGKTH
jgi:hypothetical protein